ncbi:MAG: hypothetical protein AB1483_02490 [Candidatus Zixiibacteriota bacterium]
MTARQSKLSKSRHVLLVTALALSGLFALVILQSCDNSLDYGEEALSQDATSFFDQPFYDDALAKRTDIVIDETFTVSSLISAADGGVVLLDVVDAVSSLEFDGVESTERVSADLAEAFIIMPLSFAYDTVFQIQVTKIVTADEETPVIYDFGPDGLVFSRPAVLRINAFENFGKNTLSVCLYWLNEASNAWELEEEVPVDPNTGLAYFEIDHFSKYGTGSSPTKKNTDI